MEETGQGNSRSPDPCLLGWLVDLGLWAGNGTQMDNKDGTVVEELWVVLVAFTAFTGDDEAVQ